MVTVCNPVVNTASAPIWFIANSVNEDILLVENDVRKLAQITQKPLQLLSAVYLHSTPLYWFTKMSQCNTTFDLLWKIVKISAIIWVNPSNKGFWVIYAKSPFLLSSWCPNYKQTTNKKHWKRTTMLIAFKYWVDKNLLFRSL